MRTFKLGADPEIFVGDALSVRSIIGKMGGTKEQPLPMPIGDGFAVQEDNVALEFNIPASGSKEAFVGNITLAREFLATTMKDAYGYNLVNQSAVSFPESELQHPAAHVFGCDPDYNAWTGRTNPRPRATDRNLRSCGGHVHIGVEGRLSRMQKRSIIKACDLFLGVPSVLMDKGELRKQLYGSAGAFRDKSYGAEYRTLSNFWVFDERLTQWVWDNTERAIENMEMDFDPLIQECINKNNKDVALQLVKRYNLEVVV